MHINNLRKNSELDECVIIQTCNRIELFGKSKNLDNSDKIKKTWASIAGLDEEVFEENIEFVENQEALTPSLKTNIRFRFNGIRGRANFRSNKKLNNIS